MDLLGLPATSAPLAGANCYYLLTRAADPSLQREVLQTLDDCVSMNLKILRIWAFCDGADQWNSLQVAPGQYSEATFRGLDFLLHSAQQRGLKLILTCTNYFDAFGGIGTYVRWAGGSKDDKARFFSDAQCKRWFGNYLRDLLSRVSTLDHVPYAKHPAVLGLDLINEPRLPDDPTGTTWLSWLQEMTGICHVIAPSVPLTVGLEGFDDSGFIPSTPNWARGYGVPFTDSMFYLDFASIHLWPDQWLPDASPESIISWACEFIREHAAALRVTHPGRPLFVSEFGCMLDGPPRPSPNRAPDTVTAVGGAIELESSRPVPEATTVTTALAPTPQEPAAQTLTPKDTTKGEELPGEGDRGEPAMAPPASGSLPAVPVGIDLAPSSPAILPPSVLSRLAKGMGRLFRRCGCLQEPAVAVPRSAGPQESPSVATQDSRAVMPPGSTYHPLGLARAGSSSAASASSPSPFAAQGAYRLTFYRDVLETIRLLPGTVGLFWMLAAETYPDYDSYTVYLKDCPKGSPMRNLLDLYTKEKPTAG